MTDPTPAATTPGGAPEPTTSVLTPILQDYLKVIWSATEWGNPPATIKSLAERLDVSPASASDTVKRLGLGGYIDHEPYKRITLTALGQHHAVHMVRRHRLIEAFLETTLGYSPAEVHDEAERLEHAASDLMIDRIDALLGHPTKDPHGDPIPARDGTIAYPEGAYRLTDAANGTHTIVRISDSDASRVTHITTAGLTPGTTITITSTAPGVTMVDTEHGTLAINDHTADGILLISH